MGDTKDAAAAARELASLKEELEQLALWCLHSEPLFSSRQGTPDEVLRRERDRMAGRIRNAVAAAEGRS